MGDWDKPITSEIRNTTRPLFLKAEVDSLKFLLR